MSYILDALKKAEAERERGAVPGLNAQPSPLDNEAGDDSPAAPATPAWVWPAMALLAGLAVALGWALMGRDGPQDNPPIPAQVATSPTPTPTPAPPPAPETPAELPPAPAPQAPQAEAAPAGDTAAAAPPDTPVASPPARQEPERPRRREAASPPPPAPREAERSEARPPASATRPTAAPPPSPRPAPAEPPAQRPTRILALRDLPASVRQSLPTLAIGGAMHSDNPASRMLIINSQVFREGDRIAPDLTLEEIRLKSAVFAYKDLRYTVDY